MLLVRWVVKMKDGTSGLEFTVTPIGKVCMSSSVIPVNPFKDVGEWSIEMQNCLPTLAGNYLVALMDKVFNEQNVARVLDQPPVSPDRWVESCTPISVQCVPTCSAYPLNCLRMHTVLALHRLASSHPADDRSSPSSPSPSSSSMATDGNVGAGFKIGDMQQFMSATFYLEPIAAVCSGGPGPMDSFMTYLTGWKHALACAHGHPCPEGMMKTLMGTGGLLFWSLPLCFHNLSAITGCTTVGQMKRQSSGNSFAQWQLYLTEMYNLVRIPLEDQE